MSQERRPLRVLSIDGGGMRGLYTAAYMSTLAKRFAASRGVSHLDVGAGFDLITGTSTGGMIACALAAGISLDRVAALYEDHGHEIFPVKLPTSFGVDLARQVYKRPAHLSAGAAALERALSAELGDMTMADVWNNRGIALAIPAVEMCRHHAWLFKTPHLPATRHRDDDYRLVDVCLATTAAPIYRSMARLKNPDTPGHHVFVDGGLWANNPVLIGLIDALEMTGPGDRIEIFCLGSCPRPEGELVQAEDIHRGLVGWKFGGEVVSLGLAAQEYAFDKMAQMLARHVERDCRIVRFPQGKVPSDFLKYLDLDDTRAAAMEALVNQAQTDVYETLSCCRDGTDVSSQLVNSLLQGLPAAEEAA